MAADVPISQYRPATILYVQGRGPSQGSVHADWDAACVAAATPACDTFGQCLSNARGKFKPNYGAGCEYTFTHPTNGASQVFYQSWAYPTRWCPAGFAYETSTRRCVKAESYQDTNVCPTNNPVYASDGSKRQSEVDFFYAIGGRRVSFERTFFSDSLVGFRGPVGWGWSLKPWSRALNIRMAGTGSRIILATRDAGRTYAFQPDASNVWRATPHNGIDIRANSGGWLLNDASAGELEQYDSSGVLRQLWRASGLVFTLSYSDASTPPDVAPVSGLLIRVDAGQGPALTLTYDGQGRLSSAGLDGFAIASYAYDTSRPILPTAVRFSDGSERTYVYDANIAPSEAQALASTTVFVGLANESEYKDWALSAWQGLRQLSRRNVDPLTGIVDESGKRYSTYQYDSAGRVIGTVLSDGVSRHTFTYSPLPGQTVVTDPSGTESTRTYGIVGGRIRLISQTQAAGSGCGASTAQIAYGTNANPLSIDDVNENRVCYAHDLGRNLEVTRVEGLAGGPSGVQCGSVTGSGAVLPLGSRKISTQWHPDWHLKARVSEPRVRRTFTYQGQDPQGTGTAVQCGGSGVALPLLPNGRPPALLCSEIEQATTDANGSQGFASILKAESPDRVRKWTYNEFGQILTETDALNRTTAYEYYLSTSFAGTGLESEGYAKGDLKAITNPAGHITRFTRYNRAGQLLESADPNNVTTTYAYDARQRLTSVTIGGRTTTYAYWPTGLLKQATQPDGTYVQYEYDDAHRLTATSDNLGNRIDYVLDAAGHRTAERVKDPSGTLRRQLSRLFDALGRVEQTTGRE